MTRLRRLIATALVDSFGLSLGWTVFSLQITRTHGLAGLGLCNAAMTGRGGALGPGGGPAQRPP
jgi:hypothetical protein